MIKLQCVIISCCLVWLLCCCVRVSSDELAAGQAIGFSTGELRKIKRISGAVIEKYIPAHLTAENADIRGIRLDISFSRIGEIREHLAGLLHPGGYLVFVAVRNYEFNHLPDSLAVIRSSDQLRILRLQQTAGRRKGQTVAEVIRWLQQWHNSAPFEITGAGSYWLEARFTDGLPELGPFTEALTTLCPELLNDGTGRLQDLQAEIAAKNGFRLLF